MCRAPGFVTADIRLASGGGIAAMRRIYDRRSVPVASVTAGLEELHATMATVVTTVLT